MNYTFNKKDRFYDYFPSLPMMRLRQDFGMEFYEQNVFKQHIQRLIVQAYNRLVDLHDLKHANVYPKIGDEFDRNFYNELKRNLLLQFQNDGTWSLLDNLIKNKGFDSDKELENFKTIVLSAIGMGFSNNMRETIKKEAFVAMFKYDFEKLTGQEMLYLSEIQ